MEELKHSIKLFVDSETKKVLYAEVDKDCLRVFRKILFMDFISVIRLLKSDGMFGGLDNLHTSLKILDSEVTEPGLSKSKRLKATPLVLTAPRPSPISEFRSSPISEFALDKTPPRKKRTERKLVLAGSDALGLGSGTPKETSKGLACVEEGDGSNALTETSKGQEGGTPIEKESGILVEMSGGQVSSEIYIISDSLLVEPLPRLSLSTLGFVNLLKKLRVQNVQTVEEKEVTLTNDKVLKIIKASTTTNEVLTTAFLRE